MNIELQKIKGYGMRGSKRVFVDGVQWATIRATSRGMHGLVYKLTHGDGFRPVERPARVPSAHRKMDAVVLSSRDVEKGQNTDVALQTMVKQAIDEGLLRHPELVAREAEEQNRVHAERQREARELAQKLRREKAEEALEAGTIDAILTAMDWAADQTFS